jgi:kinesin family protein 2/24
MDPELLAPAESGAQLLRLPVPEFLTRCLKTEGVSPEQAQAFHAKLWKLHIDSQKMASSSSKPAGKPAAGVSRMELLDSSADPEPDAASIPFKERIRPGMVVRWNPPAEYASFSVGGKSYAMVMCPAQAAGNRVRDVRGELVNPADGDADKEEKGEAYLSALVMPALLPGSFGVALWRQVVVIVDEMEAEVLMEWDEATRYFYMTV